MSREMRPVTLKWVKISDLAVDSYQRNDKDKMKRVRKIKDSWDWMYVKPLIVNRREGKYFVIDGQHTALAAEQIGIEEMPVCVVPRGSSRKREAKSYVVHNTAPKKVSGYSLFKGDLEAGDENAICVKAVLDARGLGLGSTPGDRTLTCVAKVRACLKACGPEAVGEALDFLEELWGPAPATWNECAVGAFVYIFEQYPEIDRARLKSRVLAKAKSGKLFVRRLLDQGGEGGGRCARAARMVARWWNAGHSGKRYPKIDVSTLVEKRYHHAK